jgi:hypothetical protein
VRNCGYLDAIRRSRARVCVQASAFACMRVTGARGSGTGVREPGTDLREESPCPRACTTGMR